MTEPRKTRATTKSPTRNTSISAEKPNRKAVTKGPARAKKGNTDSSQVIEESPKKDKKENKKTNGDDKNPFKPTLPESWLNPEKPSYKNWAQKSKLGDYYVYCLYCCDDVLVRKKTSLLLNERLKPIVQEDFAQTLANTFFSLVIDETTDKTKTKYLALIVQFWDKRVGLKCVPFCLINVSAHTNSEEIFEIINKKLIQTSFGQNLVAFASDGAAILRGKNNSVLQKLKEQIPQLWDIHCLSHCFNLIANYASEALPDFLEQLVKTLYNHFSHSSKKTSEWLALQTFMDLKPYKIISYCEIRWSSLLDAVSRILDRWDALLTYFSENKKDSDAKYVLKKMRKPHVKPYLQFLKIFLEKIYILNKNFQKQVSQISNINDIITDFYNSCINILLKPEYKNMNINEKLKLITKVS